MSATAFAIIRVPRGAGRPSEDQFRAALAADRKQLHLAPGNGSADFATGGPYEILVDGKELDEYVAWEK
jgi:hypothetical protein